MRCVLLKINRLDLITVSTHITGSEEMEAGVELAYPGLFFFLK